jgi:hypothetical protein
MQLPEKAMRRSGTRFVVLNVLIFLSLYFFIPSMLIASGGNGAAQEIIPDANTVLLDHFNGNTVGTVYGPLSYETSLQGLAQAGRFAPGTFIQYAFPAWYTYCCGSSPSTQGTIELWVKPDQWGDLLNFNWNSTTTVPPAGHVLYAFGVFDWSGDAFGYTTWNGERCCYPSGLYGTSVMPTGQWIHLAISWSPTVSKLYVNGVVEASVASNVYPAIAPTVYAYLNVWGNSTFEGLIDELHISKIQRTDEEILLHATLTPTVIEVAIDIKPGSFPNSINPNSNGIIPVAILTTAAFDATTVDPLSVEFGPNGATESHGKGHIEDADGDGDLDMVLHFKTQQTGIQCGDTDATLTGTANGQNITGTDAIQTVGCSSPKAVAEGENEVSLPEGFALYQNYPNPFNPETDIRFYLPEPNHVSISIFNIRGEEIRRLVDSPYATGEHKIRWDGKDNNGNPVSSGVYLYRLKAGSFTEMKKMTLIR